MTPNARTGVIRRFLSRVPLLLPARIPLARDWPDALRDLWRESRRSTRLQQSGRFDAAAINASYRRWHRGRPDVTGAERVNHNGPVLAIAALDRGDGRQNAIVASLERQRYTRWQLHLVQAEPAQSTGPVTPVTSGGSRVHLHPSDSTRADLDPVAEFLVLLPADAEMDDGALLLIARRLQRERHIDWLYTDEDRVTAFGTHEAPYLKGGFSPELSLTDGYATRLAVVRLASVPGDRRLADLLTSDGRHDLLLRLTERPEFCVAHLPEVCLHGRCEMRDDPLQPANDALLRRGLPAHVELHALAGGRHIARVKWNTGSGTPGPVTVVIPTRDRLDLIRPCIRSLAATADGANTRVLIMDDSSTRPETVEGLRELATTGHLTCRIIRISREGDFNYSALMNRAALEADTPLLLHLNDDVQAVEPGWIEQMAGWFHIPDVAVVGARLLRPDRSVQHAGVILNARDGLPLHVFEGLDADDPGYMNLACAARNVSAVTGACLMTRTSVFRELGGFDAVRLAVQYNDIDYCIRVRAAGLRVVYEPGATLIHRTSASRRRMYSGAENRYFRQVYGSLRDAYWSPHLDARSIATPTPLLMGN